MNDLSKTVNEATNDPQMQYDHLEAVRHGQMGNMTAPELAESYEELGNKGFPRAWLALADMQHRGHLDKHDAKGIKISKAQNIGFISKALLGAGTDQDVRSEAKGLLESMAERMQDRVALLEVGEPASDSQKDREAFKYATQKDEQDTDLLPIIENALNEDARLHIEQNEIYSINGNDAV